MKESLWKLLLGVGMMCVTPALSHAVALREVDDIKSITIWERTTSLFSHTFAIDSNKLLNRRPLGASSFDFEGVDGREFYDVYYSNADGSWNVDGEFLTIDAIFAVGAPFGGGLNITEVGLNFYSAAREYADEVTHFVGMGNNFIAGSQLFAIDGSFATHTVMGNTLNGGRLSLTLGFGATHGSNVPEPCTLLLLTTGGLAAVARRQRGRAGMMSVQRAGGAEA